MKFSTVNPDKEAVELLTRTLLVDGELQVAKSSFLHQFRQRDLRMGKRRLPSGESVAAALSERQLTQS